MCARNKSLFPKAPRRTWNPAPILRAHRLRRRLRTVLRHPEESPTRQQRLQQLVRSKSWGSAHSPTTQIETLLPSGCHVAYNSGARHSSCSAIGIPLRSPGVHSRQDPPRRILFRPGSSCCLEQDLRAVWRPARVISERRDSSFQSLHRQARARRTSRPHPLRNDTQCTCRRATSRAASCDPGLW